MDDSLAAVVAAVRAQIEGAAKVAEAEQVLAELRAARDQAVRRFIAEQGLSPLRATPLIRAALLEAGFTEDQLKGAGVSLASIRLAVERPKP